MAVRKPSERSKSYQEPIGLNITPYLDIVTSIMLFIMVTSTGLAQIGMINVNAPSYSDPLEGGGGQEDDEKKDEKQLNLTVGITYDGLFIAGVGGVLGDASAPEEERKGPTVPLLTADADCREAMAKKAPPPAKCYDYKRLTREMIKIKDEFPKETKIIIYAQPDVPYEILVNVMDATRQTGDRSLFYDVILSPEIS
ncbi:MAG: biopolymer transporter ExbD [Deltaproteobacteria bacterium]|nr:biopolymer transporter ExbD [Deltaproteobacteria bacterium]